MSLVQTKQSLNEPLQLDHFKGNDKLCFVMTLESPDNIMTKAVHEPFADGRDNKLLSPKEALNKKVQEMNQLLQKKQLQQNQKKLREGQAVWPISHGKSYSSSYKSYMTTYLKYVNCEDKELGANTIFNMKLGRNIFSSSSPNIPLEHSCPAKSEKRVTFNHIVKEISDENGVIESRLIFSH